MRPLESIDRLSLPVACLAEAVSLAIRIEPQLLRKMRIELFPSGDAALEADLWFSPLVESRAPSGIVLEPNAAQLLRLRLADKPETLNAAWRIIEALHQNISPAIFAEERLAFLALAGRNQEARELLRSVVATLLSQRGHELSGWVARALQRFPDEVREMEEAQMLAFGASLRLGDGTPLETGLRSELASAWTSWLSPEKMERVPIGVALLEDAVEFGPVGRTLSHRLELPKTAPLLAEVRWHDGARARSERITLQPQKLSILELGRGVNEVRILTVLGDSHRLSVPTAEESKRIRKLGRVRPPSVQITYDVHISDAIEKKQLPFVVGVLADLSSQPEQPLAPLHDRRFVSIDRDNFDQVMASFKPHLAFRVRNFLSDEPGYLAVDLRFDSMESFEPVRIARQIGPLRTILEQRMAIHEVIALLEQNEELENLFVLHATDPNSERALYELGRGLQQAGVSTGGRAEELLVTFLAHVDLTASSKDAVRPAHDRISAFDALLSKQLSEIMQHPAFQKLEATWRGLRYLVNQTDTSPMLKIRVWNIAKQELAHDFERASQFEQSEAFRKIYEGEYGVFGGEPYGVLIGAYDFGKLPQDTELLENMSHVAAAAKAPFLAAAGPDLFHLTSFADLGRPRDLEKIFDTVPYERWHHFRRSEDARYVGLTLPRILLRLPYGNTTVPVEEFRFEEDALGTDHTKFLWGNAAFPLAARITDAFAIYGWCAAIRGVEGGGLWKACRFTTFKPMRGMSL